MIDEIILEIKDKMKNGKWSFISDLVKFLMSLVRRLLHFINGTLVPLNVGGNYSYNLELFSSCFFSVRQRASQKQTGSSCMCGLFHLAETQE